VNDRVHGAIYNTRYEENGINCTNFFLITFISSDITCDNIKQFSVREYYFNFKLETSQSPQTSAKAMLFARWQHHIQFGRGFPYGPLKAMLTKISK